MQHITKHSPSINPFFNNLVKLDYLKGLWLEFSILADNTRPKTVKDWFILIP